MPAKSRSGPSTTPTSTRRGRSSSSQPKPPPSGVDWLARKRRGVIDFTLPGDPPELPAAVRLARIAEYYAQLHAPRVRLPPPPVLPADPDPRPAPARLPDWPPPDDDDPGYGPDDWYR